MDVKIRCNFIVLKSVLDPRVSLWPWWHSAGRQLPVRAPASTAACAGLAAAGRGCTVERGVAGITAQSSEAVP